MARQAKRKLTDIDFNNDTAHVALVSKEQGGPANGHDYALLIKAASPEFIEKVQSVTVTMELPDFLSKFFYLWGEDAKALAYLMGYVEPAETQGMENEEAQMEFDRWVQENIGSIDVMKSLADAEDVSIALANVSEDDYLQILKTQSKFEEVQKGCGKGKGKGKVTKAKAKEAVADPVIQDDEEVVDTAPEIETVTKAQFDEIQKAVEAVKAELQKANEQIAAFKKAEQEAIEKSRFALLKAVVSDEEKAKVLFKAINLVTDQKEFESVIKTLEDVTLSNQSSLFKEAGVEAQGSEEITDESPVTRLLKAKYQTK